MRILRGVITSAKMQNTVTVMTEQHVFHPVYKKRYQRNKKYHADTNGHKLNEGDTVEITECRPLSKTKCFRVTQLVSKGLHPVQHVEDAESTSKKNTSTSAQ